MNLKKKLFALLPNFMQELQVLYVLKNKAWPEYSTSGDISLL